MDKILTILIELFSWISIFVSPVMGFGTIALFLYLSNKENFWIAIILLFAGIVTGTLWAEYARKKYGCLNYLSRISGTPDIRPNEADEKDK